MNNKNNNTDFSLYQFSSEYSDFLTVCITQPNGKIDLMKHRGPINKFLKNHFGKGFEVVSWEYDDLVFKLMGQTRGLLHTNLPYQKYDDKFNHLELPDYLVYKDGKFYTMSSGFELKELKELN